MEMNQGFKVEHPVTEMITGIDMIKEQIKIAAGEKLAYRQKDIKFHGHAIECRYMCGRSKAGIYSLPGVG